MSINDAIFQLTRRAESNDPSRLVQTFVDVGSLIPLISSNDHQILCGRRGTGKTHALTFLSDAVNKKAQLPIYIDLRKIGSTGNIYSDPEIPFTERGTRLLCDVLTAIYEVLSEYVIGKPENIDPDAYSSLENFIDSISQTKIIGTVETTTQSSSNGQAEAKTAVTISKNPSITFESSQGDSQSQGISQKEAGILLHSVNFGNLTKNLDLITKKIKRRIWILVDEWSVIPLELQPLLADLFRRAFFPVKDVTVKIAAIEHRSKFLSRIPIGGYIGIEIGADASADTNLDDFMVFDNDPEKAKTFFEKLLLKHLVPILIENKEPKIPETSKELINLIFTQHTAFDDLVRAAEGVPRDAINILVLAAQKAGNEKITVNNLRIAARTWYQRDKQSPALINEDMGKLLHWIIDEVIGNRRARAFLLQSNKSHKLIDSLFDARILHILKKTVSAKDQPGIRFNVYGLDYGCYVDLVTTARAPKGLLQDLDALDDDFLEVPPDDFRSIRRAILDLDQFAKQLEQ